MLDKKDPYKSNYANVALKYSGMAFEMLATILVGWWLGKQLDHYLEFKKPVFGIVFILVFTILSMIRVISSLDKTMKK